MASIVLLWNADPNESSVTKELALKLKEAIESRDHKVSIVKVPFKYSIHSRYSRLGMVGVERDTLANPGSSDFVNTLAEKQPESFFIELHTTPSNIYRQSTGLPTKIKKWKTGEEPDTVYVQEKQLSIRKMIYGTYLNRYFVVEMPAEYKKARTVFRRLLEKGGSPMQMLEKYFSHETDLRATKSANFLSPLIVRKLAHQIDSTVNTAIGKYKRPKRPPNKSRKPIRRK